MLHEYDSWLHTYGKVGGWVGTTLLSVGANLNYILCVNPTFVTQQLAMCPAILGK